MHGSGSDPDSGDTLTYNWPRVSGTTVTLSNTTAGSPTFTAPSIPSTLVFRLTVSDGTLSATDDVTITVQQLLDFSALPGYGESINEFDDSYGAVQNLTDFSGTDLSAVEA